VSSEVTQPPDDGSASVDSAPNNAVAKASYWQQIEHRRAWGIGGGIALALAVALGVFAVSQGRTGSDGGSAESTRTITPAEETTETTVADSLGTTATISPEATPAAAVGTAVPGPVPGRATLVAYRRDGWLCVAAEDGSGERRVAESAAGVFSLSPDGTVLAFVDSATGTLVLADVGSGGVKSIGPAVQDTPSWVPDSGWVVYTMPGPKVARALRDGIATTVLFEGSMPSVSTHEAVVVGLAPTGEISVLRQGVVSKIRPDGSVTALASDGTNVYYGSIAPQSGAVSLRAVGIDGSGKRTLVSGPAASRAVTFGDLLLAPNADRLVYAERSDDGYSRMFAVPPGGGAPTDLSVRRDCYPLRWTADGASVFFIEGNAIQGDPTALMRVSPAGGSRRLLVDGANR
jgi:Tol biopolymer transport system component